MLYNAYICRHFKPRPLPQPSLNLSLDVDDPRVVSGDFTTRGAELKMPGLHDATRVHEDFGTGGCLLSWSLTSLTNEASSQHHTKDDFSYTSCNASKCIEGLKDWGKCKQPPARCETINTASRPETEQNRMSQNPFCWPTLAPLYPPLRGSDIHQVRLAALHSCSIVGSF